MIQIRLACAALIDACEGAEFIDISVPAHNVWQASDTANENTEMIVTDGRDIFLARKSGDRWVRDNGTAIDSITHVMPSPELPCQP